MNRLALALVLPLVAFGCSSNSAGSTTTDDAGDMSDMGSDDSMPSDDTGAMEAAPDAPATAPNTPAVTMVMPMSGALHVTWKLNDTGLTNVELWRKQGTGAYALAYTLPGSAIAQHDMQANATGTTYCYQVKTIRAGMESQLSNEKCGTP
jgi:hypothetical protein